MKTAGTKARQAASLLLIALAVQLGGSLLAEMANLDTAWLIGILFYVLSGWATVLLGSRLSLAAAICGAGVCLALPFSLLPQAASVILTNVIYIALYLPVQRVFDQRLKIADVSRATLTIGRGWSLFTLIGRALSIADRLPYFAGQDKLSAAQGHFTALFQAQLAIEVAGLLAVVISYVFMVRYLWRAKNLLTD